MPQMSGRELAERVLERWSDVPILFTSGYTGLFVVQRGLLDEDQEFIQKPIAPDTLAQKVREMLDRNATERSRSTSLGGEDQTKSGDE
jgi:two-component system cell cycle sensor histidine kinase/response regulator CckA